jgi:hypothetical protein
MTKWSLIAAVILASGFGTAQAAAVGTQGFADIGSPTVDTGNINSATVFNIGDMVSTGSQMGVFVGMPTQNVGPFSFNDTVGSSMTFGDGVFGTFSSTSILEYANSPGSVSFYVVGSWTPGSYVGGLPGPASFNLNFNQNPAGTGSISDSGTFSIPPTGVPGVPEPSSLTLALTAVAGAGLFSLARRRWSRKAAA